MERGMLHFLCADLTSIRYYSKALSINLNAVCINKLSLVETGKMCKNYLKIQLDYNEYVLYDLNEIYCSVIKN